MIILVAAIGKNGELGKNGKLCFTSPKDMKHFRELTLGETVVMGSKTYQSIGHALPDRDNVVVSRTIKKLPDAMVVDNLNAVLDIAEEDDGGIYFIGGAKIYEQAIKRASLIYLTEFEAEDNEADAFFPMSDLKRDFEFVFGNTETDDDGLRMRLMTFRRKSGTEKQPE